MRIPILKGIVADETAAFRSSLPVNFEPVFVDNGINKGYLKAVPGIRSVSDTGLGPDRGGIVWNGIHYRVIGSAFVQVSAQAVTIKGYVANDGLPVSMDYSFDLLGIASGGALYYFDGNDITQVTDPALDYVLDMMWLDGRFITTDGDSIVLTKIQDPYSVDPLVYGSSEVSPDPIVALVHVRGEMYAVNSNTIENFNNIGGVGFPYQRQPGALIPKGAVGTHAVCYFLDTFAFVGGSPSEAPSVWLAGGGEAACMSTPDVDRALSELTGAQLQRVEIEARQSDGEQRLLVHLPDRTLCYSMQASKKAGEPIWHELRGGVAVDQPYPLRHLTLVGSEWIGGTEDGRIGVLDDTIQTQFDAETGWRFDTLMIYNEARGGILHSAELIGLPGRVPMGAQPRAFLSTTFDGETWSQERAIETGRRGEREKRVQWRPNRRFSNYMGLRFRGVGNGRQGWSALEAEIEALT